MKIDLTYTRLDKYFVAIKQGDMACIQQGIKAQDIDLNHKYSQKGKVLQESLIHAAIRLNQPDILQELVRLPTFDPKTHLKAYVCYFEANHKSPVVYDPRELATMLNSESCLLILAQAAALEEEDLSPPVLDRETAAIRR